MLSSQCIQIRPRPTGERGKVTARWLELLRFGVDIFALDYDAILSAMYVLSASAEGDCYRRVPPDPSIAAAALGASESGTLPGTAPAEALHTFTLDSGASHCFFCESTTLTPLPAPVPVRLADPFGGPVVARSSTVLPCPTTLLWHHHLGHPSLPRLHGMHSRLLVSGLPRSLRPLAPSPAPPCLPCNEGRQCAAPHSSSFPLTTAPLHTLHMDVWGPDRVSGQGRERYVQLVVTPRSSPLRSKGEEIPVLRLHYDRGGEFSSDFLRDFCRGEGILLSFTLPDSPQQNRIAERRIGLVMEVAHTSMIHAAAPHFLWPFAVRYAAHQLNLWPRVSLPETLQTLRWMGKIGNASVFRVWGSRAFARDTSADKLSARAIPCVLAFPLMRLVGSFTTPPRAVSSPLRTSRPPLLVPLPPQGPAPSGVSQVDPLPSTAPVEVAVCSGAAQGAVSGGVASRGAEPGVAESEGAGSGGAEPRGEEPGGAEPAGVEPGGAELEGVEPVGAESEGAESGGAEPKGAASFGGPAGASPRLSPQQLREWLVQHARLGSGATGAGGAGAAGGGCTGVTTGAGGTGGIAAIGPGGARTRGTGAAGAGGAGAGGTGVGGAGAGGAGAGGAGAVGRGDTVRPRLAYLHCSSRSSFASSSCPRHARYGTSVFGLDKFNGDNFAEWSFKMENIFDHYDLLEVMEGTEKRPENDPEKSPWVRKSAHGYLLLGKALESSQIRHIKPFQREPEKGPKAWAALKGVHAPATAAVAVVLERQMAALRIEEDEAVEEGVQKFFDLFTRLEGADLNYSELQKKTKLLALLPESWSSLIINLNRDLPRLSLEDVKRAILQEDFRRLEAAGVVDTAATTRSTDAVAADSTASATIVTRADICGAIASSSLMDGLLLKAKRVEEQEEGEEEAVEAVAVAEVVLQV
ncbi:unnamed protein product [Closterium sp. NIES-53]